nr:bone morphogenetic protein 8B-like [Mirounga angustirostris]
MAVFTIVTNDDRVLARPPSSRLPRTISLGSSDEETETLCLRAQGPAQARAEGSLLSPVPSPCARVTALSPLSVPGHSVDPGLAGLLGRRAPRSKQPFLVTFFRASPSPIRAPRAARPLKRRPPKKTNELPHANRLPGIFDDVHGADGRHVCRRHELYVSFQDLGWLDWVIAPQGYSAYYCEGECSFPLDSCMNATNHAILQSLVSTASVGPGPRGEGLGTARGTEAPAGGSGALSAQNLPWTCRLLCA